MKRFILHSCWILVILLTLPLHAQFDSQPGGLFMLGAYNTHGSYLGLLSNSDTMVALPFTRVPVFAGSVTSVSGNVVTVAGTPGWTANQFVYNGTTQTNTFYALLGPGSGTTTNPKQGCLYTVTTNDTNTVTLALNGDSISAVPANSRIILIPYWTLGTLFPASKATVSFTASTSTSSYQTQVLLPNTTSAGINLPFAETYYFINSGTNIGWRLVGDVATTDHANDVLMPDSYLVVRNPSTAPTLPLIVYGSVVTQSLSIPLTTQASSAQDNSLGMTRPVDVSLNTCGLNPTDGSFTITTSTRSIQDELFLYANTTASQNKAPSATYYYMNSAWRLYGDSTTTDHGADLIPTGSAITIRKAATASGVTDFWSNPPNY